MEIPHDVQVRVKDAEGSLDQKQGDMGMHAVKLLMSNCPGCGAARDAVFRRQGTDARGVMLLWAEFKCFVGTCRLAWVVLFRLMPEPVEAKVGNVPPRMDGGCGRQRTGAGPLTPIRLHPRTELRNPPDAHLLYGT